MTIPVLLIITKQDSQTQTITHTSISNNSKLYSKECRKIIGTPNGTQNTVYDPATSTIGFFVFVS